MSLTPKQIEQVRDVVDMEGFDYAFCYHSDFKEMKDKKFHCLRENYVQAARELREYLEIEES